METKLWSLESLPHYIKPESKEQITLPKDYHLLDTHRDGYCGFYVCALVYKNLKTQMLGEFVEKEEKPYSNIQGLVHNAIVACGTPLQLPKAHYMDAVEMGIFMKVHQLNLAIIKKNVYVYNFSADNSSWIFVYASSVEHYAIVAKDLQIEISCKDAQIIFNSFKAPYPLEEVNLCLFSNGLYDELKFFDHVE